MVVYGDGFQAVSDSLLVVLVAIEQALRAVPPVVFVAAVAALAFAAGRSLRLAAAMAAVCWFVGALGLWDQAMQTVAIVLVSVAISVLVGLPLGVLAAKRATVRAGLAPLLDLMQTIPSFVYLIPAAMLFGLGKVPAILATVVYATPPLVRLTDLGIRQVDAAATEAARAFGASPRQLLWGVELPLALPAIMQGVNQTVMMALGMVVIASMIGARGVGETVLLGLQRGDAGQGFVGGLGIVLLAVAFDRITQAWGRRLQAGRGG
ncbi:ABC transporter permease [Allostella sp. ATCC 35155]|nr:ABC transporter permease [Stella sp. ATCC 35155]